VSIFVGYSAMAVADGYPKLARLMSLAPETAIFRRFNDLTMLNLLRLQAELQELENQLEETRIEDESSDDQVRQQLSRDFHLMREYVSQGQTDSLQHALLQDIAEKIKEYRTILRILRCYACLCLPRLRS
jgi:hypothetical protein